MKKINFISQVLAVMFFTLMVVIDFFPDIGISMSIGVIGLVIFILLSALSRQKGVPVFTSSKQEFIFKVFAGIYFFSLLIILSLLGGASQVGIGLNNPIIWGLFLIGVLVSYTKYKKDLRNTSNNGSGTFQ